MNKEQALKLVTEAFDSGFGEEYVNLPRTALLEAQKEIEAALAASDEIEANAHVAKAMVLQIRYLEAG